MSARKLQQEMDRVFKRVGEGIVIFDSIYDKLQMASNQSQKEKLEQDLKREIKKLQKLRDQIKTWISSNDIRDKKQLVEQRKLIENDMERFKAVEREVKTKAYSREGLQKGERSDDPREKEKREAVDFLQTQIEELEGQTETLEGEQDQVQSSMKKGKKDSVKQDRIAEIEHAVERHKWHISQMEIMIHMIDSDTLAPESVMDLQDDIVYYVESNQDADFAEDDAIYEDLNLVVNDDDAEPIETITRDDNTYTLEDLAQDLSKEKEKEERERERRRERGEPLSPSPQPTLLPKDIKDLKLSPVTSREQVPVASSSTREREGSAGALRKSASPPAQDEKKVPQGLNPLPPPQQSQPPSSVSTPVQDKTPQKAKVQPKANAHAQAQAHAIAQAQLQAQVPSQPQTPVHGQPPALPHLQGMPQPMPQFQPALTRESTPVHVSASQVHQSVPGTPTAQAMAAATGTSGPIISATPTGPPGVSGPGIDLNELPPGLQDLVHCFDAARQRLASPAPAATAGAASIGKLIESSYLSAPDAALADVPRLYHPESPYPTPDYYPTEVLASLEDPEVFVKMDEDTLFYIFYYRQRTHQQYLAAKELKRRNWRFHKRFLTWFQRHEEPQVINSEYEMGTYRFFDFEGSWLQRRKTNFKFDYQYLEQTLV